MLKVNSTAPYEIGWLGQITEEIDAEDNVTRYERDPVDGRLLSVTTADPDGTGPESEYVTHYQYQEQNGFSALTGVSLPDGSSLTWTYDWEFGIPTSFTDELGNSTIWTLDPNYGNVLSERRVVGEIDDAINLETDDIVTNYTYTPTKALATDSPGGLVTSIVDALGQVTEFDYDSSGNVTRVTYAVGTTLEAFIEFEYDTWNRLVEFRDELGRQTDFDYDALKRLTKVTLPDPDGTGPLLRPSTESTYNEINELVKQVDALGRVIDFGFDTRRNHTRLDLPDHDGNSTLTTTNYAYNLANQRTSTTDPLGRITSYVYDTLARR